MTHVVKVMCSHCMDDRTPSPSFFFFFFDDDCLLSHQEPVEGKAVYSPIQFFNTCSSRIYLPLICRTLCSMSVSARWRGGSLRLWWDVECQSHEPKFVYQMNLSDIHTNILTHVLHFVTCHFSLILSVSYRTPFKQSTTIISIIYHIIHDNKILKLKLIFFIRERLTVWFYIICESMNDWCDRKQWAYLNGRYPK